MRGRGLSLTNSPPPQKKHPSSPSANIQHIGDTWGQNLQRSILSLLWTAQPIEKYYDSSTKTVKPF